MASAFEFIFEWDPSKAKGNAKKHGVSFEQAATIFQDPQALTLFDEEHSEKEDRWVTMGIDKHGKLLVACHTYDEGRGAFARIRIISARKATKKETTQYKRKVK